VRPGRIAERAVLIGWPMADWKRIHPLLDAGRMPNLQRLVERGGIARPPILSPPVPELLWTSVATGHTADHHGILTATEADALTGGTRPTPSTSRRRKALWNVFSQEGLVSHVVGWPATHPAEPIRGVCVTPEFRDAVAPPGRPWPVLPDSLRPRRLEATLKDLRVHPGELTGDDLLGFLPELPGIDQDRDRRVYAVAELLAGCITNQAIATWLMEHETWDFTAVLHDAVARASLLFMRYTAPRLEWIGEEEFRFYRSVVDGAYRFQDMMLGKIVEVAGPDAAIVLVSGCGFRSGHQRPLRPVPEMTSAFWPGMQGVLCLAGPRIRKDQLIHGASLLDIAPTLLSILGLPVGSDMAGRPLAAFEGRATFEQIPSWEGVGGEAGIHRVETAEEIEQTARALARLKSLGYKTTTPATGPRQEGWLSPAAERDAHLAVVHLTMGRPEEAIRLLAPFEWLDLEDSPIRFCLAYCCVLTGQWEKLERLLGEVPRTDVTGPMIDLLRAAGAAAGGRIEEALALVLEAGRAEPRPPLLFYAIGTCYASLENWEEAERALRCAVAADGELWRAREGLARVLTKLGRFEEAAEAAVEAIGIEFHAPAAHHALAVALKGLGCEELAAHAWETCLSQGATARVRGKRR
jgi:Flp pilus assembly protein TadD